MGAYRPMDFSGHDLDILIRFLSGRPMKQVTIRGSFAREGILLPDNPDLLIELNYPQALSATFAAMKFALNGILKLNIHGVSVDGEERVLGMVVTKGKLLIFEPEQRDG